MEVWKYSIPFFDEFELDLPIQADVLTVRMQYGIPTIWVLVPFTGNDHREKRKFVLAGTGHKIRHRQEEVKYVGTFMREEFLVFHLFEVR